MSVKEILQAYLIGAGFDGLFRAESDCACLINDLMPCDDCPDDCEPGYLAPCDCGNGCNFHINRVKP